MTSRLPDFSRAALASLALLLAGLMVTSVAQATQAEHIKASHAWLRVLPAGLPAGAYVTLENSATAPAVLSRASSPSYTQVMLHLSADNGGTSRMSMVDALPIPAHGEAVLAPAAYHLMLTGAVHPVQAGDTVTINLTFSDGSTLPAAFRARPANAIDAGP